MSSSEQLITALKSNKILVKTHFEFESEFLFLDHGVLEKRGWNTAYGVVGDRLTDIVLHPENWRIHERTLTDGYPYPWSATYKTPKS